MTILVEKWSTTKFIKGMYTVVALGGFERFGQTPEFLEKGSQTPQYFEK